MTNQFRYYLGWLLILVGFIFALIGLSQVSTGLRSVLSLALLFGGVTIGIVGSVLRLAYRKRLVEPANQDKIALETLSSMSMQQNNEKQSRSKRNE